MADLLGIPRGRWPIAVAMIALLALSLTWLQGRFDSSDVKKAIALAMGHRLPGGRTLFETLSSRGEGDPRCDGKVVSQFLGDVQVSCITPHHPEIQYEFRVLLDGKRPPRPSNPEAEKIWGHNSDSGPIR